MIFPNDAVSLRRAADIIEGFFSLSQEYRQFVLAKLTGHGDPNVEEIKRRYLADHDKIKAIREVRALNYNPVTREYPVGLKEAKDIVDGWN